VVVAMVAILVRNFSHDDDDEDDDDDDDVDGVGDAADNEFCCGLVQLVC
jgi:hypothetical protein